MSQNLISLGLDNDTLSSVDAMLNGLETMLTGLIDLTQEQRATTVKMGDKSGEFCRKTLDVLSANPNVLPGNFDLAEMRRDLADFDALRQRTVRVERLYERMRDTQLALGSDVMSAALEGYALLKVSGKGEGLDLARKALSTRFSKTSRKKTETPAEV